MKKLLLVLVCILLANCSGSNNTDPVIPDTHGNTVQLSQLKGKWVIINYWASWCPACLWEIPHLNRFYENIKNKNIVILGINWDGLPKEALKKAVMQSSIQFPVLTEDPKKAWALGEYDILPVTIILNPEGKRVKVILGPTTDKDLSRILLELNAA